MFPELMKLENENKKAFDRIMEFRSELRKPGVRRTKLFNEYRGNFPYFGYIVVRETDVPSVFMFNNNDDIVAQHYFWFGRNSYEAQTMETWKNLCNISKTIVDVGSFTGLFSMIAKRINPSSRVIALEPLSPMYERMMINFKINRLSRSVESFKIGLSDKARKLTFFYFASHSVLQSGASYVHKESKDICSEETSEVVVGDEFIGKHNIKPDLIKIDVEEAEVDVINGLAETIKRYRPHILCEVSPRTSTKILEGFLRNDYDVVVVNDAQRLTIPIIEPIAVERVVNLYLNPRIRPN